MFKPIGIGTLDQVLLAKPSGNPPYQWATPTSREVLTANRTYYVRTDGNDSNNGLANTSGGAFLTVQKAVDVVATLDTSIYDVIVQLTGSFNVSSSIVLKDPPGGGVCYIRGNTTNPENVVINESGNTKLIEGLIASNFTSKWIVEGVTFSNGSVQIFGQGGRLRIGKNRFIGNSNFAINIQASGTGYLVDDVPLITGTFTNAVFIADRNAFFLSQKPSGSTLTITNQNLTFGYYCWAASGSVSTWRTTVFSNSSVTGTRYNATSNGVINTAGQPSSYFPGNTDGTVSTGGQYL